MNLSPIKNPDIAKNAKLPFKFYFSSMTKNNFKKIEKLVVNTGFGRIASQPNFEEKVLPELVKEFSLITGQKPSSRAAKQSIAGFKLRTGMVIGLKATLRRKRMRDFLEKMIKAALPRVRDFRGIDLKNIDKMGNLTVGFKEHLVFPEVSPETSTVNFGIEVTIVPKERKREKAIVLYRELGIPLKK